MSGPVPSPSMKAMMGRSGTCSLPWLIVTFSPAGILTWDAMGLLSLPGLCQGVQGGARLEPPDLLVGEGVPALDGHGLAAGLVDDDVGRLARGELREPRDADAVGLLEEVVVGGLGEREGEDPLLLEVGLVDAREAPDDHYLAAEIARRHGGVLPARSLAVVLVADHEPALALGLELPGHLGEVLPRLPGERVEALARLAREGIDGAQEHVVADLVEMATDEEPGPGGRDVVGGRLPLRLHENGQLEETLAVPAWEGLQELEPLAVGIDLHLHGIAVGSRRLVAFLALGEALGRELLALRRGEAKRLAVGARNRPVHGIELEGAAEDEGRDDLGARQEGEGRRAAVIAPGKVAVEGGDDGVALVLAHIRALPLADTGPAGIGEHGAADLLEGLHDAVPLDGLVDALRARGDQERRLGLEPRLEGLHGD